jgi:hypothetical protein
VVNACVGSDEAGPIAGRGCDSCVDSRSRIPTDTFLGIVRDANNNYCRMPEGLAADEMMTCLCASPPTCVRGPTMHSQALPVSPPPSPPPTPPPPPPTDEDHSDVHIFWEGENCWEVALVCAGCMCCYGLVRFLMLVFMCDGPKGLGGF